MLTAWRNIGAFLGAHRLILSVALLLTFLIKAPVLLFPSVAGDEYRGINLYHYGNLAVDEDFYISRGKEVLEGHALGNPLMREGKEEYQDYYFTINEQALVGPLRLLGLGEKLNVATLYAVYNTLGLFALILLIYFFALELFPAKLFATAVAVFVVSGYSILDHRAFFEPVFNMYGRSLHPYLSSLAFFGYLVLCLRVLKTHSVLRLALAGVLFGALSYIYSYAWTFAALFNGFLLVFFVMRREWRAVKTLFFVSLLGGVISIYNVAQTYLYLVSAAGQQAIFFYGAKFGRSLAYGKLGPAILFLFGGFAYRKRGEWGWPVILALLLAGWFAINQQFVTGLSIQSNHYLWYYTTPALIIALSYAFFSLVPYARLRAALLVLAISVSLCNTAVEQYRAFMQTLPERLSEQRYRPILDALKAAAPPAVVLAADDAPELLVTVYTPHDIFWESVLGKFNDNPVERHQDALLLFLYLNREARMRPDAYLLRILPDTNNHSSYRRIYRDIEGYYSGLSRREYEAWEGRGDESFLGYRKALLASLMRRYEAFADNPRGFETLLDRYGVRFVLLDKKRQAEWDLGALSGLTLAAASGEVFLFERSQ